MRKKIFFITVPMLPESELKTLKYVYENGSGDFSSPTRFPGMAMLEKHFPENEPVKIVTARTDTKNGFSDNNYFLFKNELASLSEKNGRKLTVQSELIIPDAEDSRKQKTFLRELCDQFDEKCDIYMDLTYGTKVTSIGMFSSLVYAEKIQKCLIKEIVYGKYGHDGADEGVLYDISPLYNISMLINAAALMPKKNMKYLLDTIAETTGN